MLEELFFDKSDFKETVLFDTKLGCFGDPYDSTCSYNLPHYAFYKRPMYTFKQGSGAGNIWAGVNGVGLFSLPMYCYYLDLSMQQVDYRKIYIKLKEGYTEETQALIEKDLTEAFDVYWGIYFYNKKVKEDDPMATT